MLPEHVHAEPVHVRHQPDSAGAGVLHGRLQPRPRTPVSRAPPGREHQSIGVPQDRGGSGREQSAVELGEGSKSEQGVVGEGVRPGAGCRQVGKR